ncbi:L,D-transpeptidase [Lederbergia sp. NSJ-179]|uniref:L,D-transpeptidase n=1 Tax=Lederbergia sp. NSJ-179 TaxID=2931402 RepID=UPI001FD1E018|nr:L,D-transpeptidase [Lederbergia sp. NSJ-179]MCJ7839378.1 L,D-transpeptidase [Lederbergia sp. NSJ-179]
MMIIFLLLHSPFWPMDATLLPGDSLIIVNKRTNELAWFDEGQMKMMTKVATGKNKDWTPEGLFTITVKAKNPYYRKLNIPGGDPRNPLGSRWIGFDAKGTNGRIYGLHGTNQPNSIGKYISQGCIRLDRDPLELLYDQISLGTKILVTNSTLSFEQLAQSQGVL